MSGGDLPPGVVHPFAGRHLPGLVAAQAAAHPDRPFLIWVPDGGRDPAAAVRWTYAAWAERVEHLAAALAARGLGHGDLVGVHLDNGPAFLLVWWALARIGAVCVSTNTRSVPDELAYYLEKARAVAVVTASAHRAVVERAVAAPGVGVEHAIVVDGGGALEGVRTERLADLEAEGRGHGAAGPCPAAPGDPCCVQFTSGTTSRPKGVVLTHANYLWGGQHMALHQGLRRDDVHLVQAPLFHINAQVYSVVATLTAGGTVVLAPKFSRSGFWPTALAHGATVASMIPFFVNALFGGDREGMAAERDGHRFRLWGYGFAHEAIERRFELDHLIGWYGMTETISAPIVSPLSGGTPDLAIGRPSTGYAVRVVDPGGAPVPPGEPGELHVGGVRGLSLARGYLHDEEATAAAFGADGFLRTGDRVRVDEAGWLSFVDRDKDMLKVGGENVASSEIERVVREVRGVADVAVVAVRDRLYDEVPVACVIAAPGADAAALPAAILARCREKLADFKVPRRVELCEAFPRSTLEKINKAALRDRLRRADGGPDEAGPPGDG